MKKLTLPTSKKRNAVTLALVLALALVLLAVNILLPYLAHRGNFYPDLTPEGLYTMSDELALELSYLEEDVKIIFCTDPDYLFASKETRLPYVTCKKLAAKNEHISIEYIDVANDPSAADDYKIKIFKSYYIKLAIINIYFVCYYIVFTKIFPLIYW